MLLHQVLKPGGRNGPGFVVRSSATTALPMGELFRSHSRSIEEYATDKTELCVMCYSRKRSITCYKTVPKTAKYEGKLKKGGGSQAKGRPGVFRATFFYDTGRYRRADGRFFGALNSSGNPVSECLGSPNGPIRLDYGQEFSVGYQF